MPLVTAPAPLDPADIPSMCRALGFALGGVAPAQPSAHAEFFRRWLAEGKHGEMAWLARNVETRLDPALLVPGARSVIMVADLYHERGAPDEPGAPDGRIARYARGDDYHDVMKRRLHALCDALRDRFPGHAFRACVDTAPLMEREFAARAGLGWIGKHTLLIHPRLGSWLMLGAVVTTLDIPTPVEQAEIPDHCGTCTRCIDACPTHAITPHSVDARRCISYLTIEQRTPIEDAALREGVGGWLFGCDVCQEVCPHNSPRAAPLGDAPVLDAYQPRFEALDAREVASWTDEDRRRELKGSAMKRATLEMFQRNASIVLENAARPGAHPGARPGPGHGG